MSEPGSGSLFGSLFGGYGRTSEQLKEYVESLKRAQEYLNASDSEQLLLEAQLLRSEPLTPWIN